MNVLEYAKGVEKLVEFINLEEGLKVKITFDYSHEKQIDYILKDSEIINKEYGEVIIYTALIKKELTKTLEDVRLKISEIKYEPTERDKDRFLLLMDDGNEVYLTLTKFDRINYYDTIF